MALLVFFTAPLAFAVQGHSTDLVMAKVFQHLIFAILGGLVGLFCSSLFKAFRQMLIIGVVVIGAFLLALADSTLGSVAFFVVGAITVPILLKKLIADASPAKRNTTFGSAQWADLNHCQDNNLIGREGFNLGVFPAKNGEAFPLHYAGDRHLLTVAPTRAGKGVSTIIPNLLTYEGSALVIDPKGENAMITAARRGHGDPEKGIEGMGQKVHVVDPWGITGFPSSRFNPLDWLDPDDEDINENAMLLADSIVTPHAGNSDQFWDEEAKALLMGFLLHVALNDNEQPDRSLARVRDIISLDKTSMNDILEEMVYSDNHIVSSAGARTLSKEEKLKSSIISVLQSHTHFLDSPRIRKNLSASNFKFEDLKDSKTTIYLVLPADRLNAFGRWLRILIQQAITVNARNIETKPEKPILFLLDEMAILGRLTMVEQAYGLMAGFGMQLWGIVQDLSQLHRIYGDGWQTFIGNSGVLQYFGSRDLMTAEYFSKLCGVTTIEKTSSSWTSGFSSTSGQSGSTSESSSESTSYDSAQRSLAYPDELMVLRDQREIVFVETSNPISARKVPWFKDERLQRLGVNLHQENEPVDPPEQVVESSPQVATTPQKHIFTETMETIQKELKELFALAKEKIASVKEKISKYQGKRKY